MDATLFARIYLSERRNRTGDVIPLSRFMQSETVKTCFKKLSKQIATYEAAGIDVDPYEFIKAQFAYFGEYTYPQHLIAECAYSIYVLWQSQREKGKTVQPSTHAQQHELMTYLMEQRNETEEEILNRFPHLFSADFVGT